MYVTVDFICIGWFQVWATRKKPELQNEKALPTAELEPTTSRSLDWRSTIWAMETCDCGYLKVNYIHINIGIRLAYFVTVKSDRLLDHALQCKTIIQYLNLFAIDHYRFILVVNTMLSLTTYILHCHLLNKSAHLCNDIKPYYAA